MLDCRLLDAAPPLPENALALVSFGAAARAGADPRRVRVPLPALAGPAHERWTARAPVRTGTDNGIAWARGDDALFGQMALPDGAPYAATIEAAYARILSFVEAQRFPHLLRCWNYFGDIHAGAGDEERYRQFCAGRYRALSAAPDFESRLPAATVIGSAEPGTLIYFFAAREPGRQVENPRQVSAFRYPREYGPNAPSFSRAVLKPWDGGTQLFVSGTASVVGHLSVHGGDAGAQFRETLANLRALLQAAAGVAGAPGAWQPVALKVYVREPAALPAVRRQVTETLGTRAPVLFLQGDICRTDLSVEIEGLFRP